MEGFDGGESGFGGDHAPGDELNNSADRDQYREVKWAWVGEGCLPPDEAAASICRFEAEVRAGRIPDIELREIIARARVALDNAQNGSTRALFRDVLRAAGVTGNESGE